MSGALEDYLAAVAAGTAPPREQFLAGHPELAEDLDACLAALHFIGRAAAGPRSVAPDFDESQPPEQVVGQIGDFRIVREVGRGGMGVVYEAEQISLGRRVALKVLPLAGALDPRHLQRFQNEARAAASLHHQHIVPVYAVGSERGVHYYAMQFIDGQTLADFIAELRQAGARPAPTGEQPTTPQFPKQAQPTADTAPRAAVSTEQARPDRAHFRRVAELGIQAGEALDHAHQLGIVHRDVKPANLLVDGRGSLWVADFGLAQVQSDARLTLTGDLLGTLRYMSPEQALARRVVVDHRTDVYSLGATLYELLTLEPAFTGSDRQELLRQIAFEEPVRPRRVNKAIPAELETIVLKAMEKNPQERYATAAELAEDLRHFLADQPIRARPAGVVRRLRKWGRRHRGVVVTAALGLLLALAVVAGSIGWVMRDQAARQKEAEGPVQSAMDEAERLLKQEKVREALSAALRAEGLLLHAGGHPRLGPEVQALLKDLRMLVTLEEVRLTWTAVRGSKFDNASADEGFEKAFREYGIDVEALPVEVAAARICACRIKAELVAALGSWAYARNAVRKGSGLGLFAVARAAEPDEWRGRLRDVLEGRGEAALAELVRLEKTDALPAWTLGHVVHAVEKEKGDLAQVVPLLRHAQQRVPDDFWLNHSLGYALHRMQHPQLDEAIGFYRVAVALRPGSPGARLNLGAALHAQKKLDEAVAAYQKAIALKPDYADAYRNLGNALDEQKKLDEAVAAYQKAIALKPDFADAYYNLGNALDEQKKLDEAVAAYQKAIALKPDFAKAYNNLGIILAAQKKREEATAAYRKAIDLQPDLAEAYTNLGAALCEQKKLDEAVTAFRKAIDVQPDFAGAYNSLGVALAAQKKLDEAVTAFRKAIQLKPDLAAAYYNLGNALYQQRNMDKAIAALRKAIDVQPDYAKAYTNLGDALRDQKKLDEAVTAYRKAIDLQPDDAAAYNDLGLALRDQKKLDEAVAAFRKADQLLPHHPVIRNNLRRTQRWLELDKRLPDILAGKAKPSSPQEQIELARFWLYKEYYRTAACFFSTAFTAEPKLASDLNVPHRYSAACAAALAAVGQGADAAQLDDKERARLRQQALDWLRADLTAYVRLAEQGNPNARQAILQYLAHWQQDTDLTALRDGKALAALPQKERAAWQELWADVAALCKRVGTKK
jgi:Flp pilus assembly protein TadD/serine/threonine protein kinase